MECVADALFLAVLKLPQSNLVVKDIAEVDAAGRYIPFPLVCRWLIMPSRTPLGAYYIYQRRGYQSACFLVIGRGKPRIADTIYARYATNYLITADRTLFGITTCSRESV